MKKYKERISELVRYLVADNVDEHKWKTVEENFQKWKNTISKEQAKHYFDDFLFGVCYVRELYNSRVDCFHKVLKQFLKFPEVLQIMKQSKNIVSIGCGPGPEIAAYISFLRKDLNCLDRFLDIAAVDQLSYWQQFIDAVSSLDGLTNIKFVKRTINLKFLRNIAKTDVCIMSYPHAVDFDDIWKLLKTKFSLIIVIDQPKTKLLDNVRQCGYQMIKFVYKKNKTCFFYFDPNACYQNRWQLSEIYNYGYERYNRPTLMPSSSSGIDTQMAQYSSSSPLIKCQLSCGHTIIVYGCEYNEGIRCEKLVMKRCPRNLHVKWTVCGQPFICEELCEKILGFNHSVFIKCSQIETDDFPFRKFAHHQLECENMTNRRPFQVLNMNHLDITCNKDVMQKIKRKQIETEKLMKMRLLRHNFR